MAISRNCSTNEHTFINRLNVNAFSLVGSLVWSGHYQDHGEAATRPLASESVAQQNREEHDTCRLYSD